MKRSRVLALLLAGLMALSMAACGGDSNESNSSGSSDGSNSSQSASGSDAASGLTKTSYKLGISQPNNSPYRVACAANLETWRIETEAKEGVTIETVITDGRNDPNKQVSDTEDLLAQGVDALIACPYQAPTLMNVLPQFQEQGIPVVLYDRKATDMSLADAFVGNNDLKLGQITGEAVVELTGGSGNVIILEGTQGNGPTIDRQAGLMEKFEGTGINIVSDQAADYNRAKATEVTENVLQANSDVAAIVAHSDEMAIGAYNAANAAGRAGDIMFFGMDGQKEALEMILNGELTGSAKKSVEFPAASETAWKLIKGETVEKETTLECVMVTSENIEEEYDPYSVF